MVVFEDDNDIMESAYIKVRYRFVSEEVAERTVEAAHVTSEKKSAVGPTNDLPDKTGSPLRDLAGAVCAKLCGAF